MYIVFAVPMYLRHSFVTFCWTAWEIVRIQSFTVKIIFGQTHELTQGPQSQGVRRYIELGFTLVVFHRMHSISGHTKFLGHLDHTQLDNLNESRGVTVCCMLYFQHVKNSPVQLPHGFRARRRQPIRLRRREQILYQFPLEWLLMELLWKNGNQIEV